RCGAPAGEFQRWVRGRQPEFEVIGLTSPRTAADRSSVSAESPAAEPAATDGPALGQVSGSMTSTLLRHVRGVSGEEGVATLPARVEESSCEPRGDDHCLYTVTWDADRAASAADPHELVTALETQLVAMNDRLQSMYATAEDLVAFDDVEAALARITERAATAVRAPKYLLAVNAGPDGDLHVHHRGFEDHEAAAVARNLLADDPAADDEPRLVGEVES